MNERPEIAVGRRGALRFDGVSGSSRTELAERSGLEVAHGTGRSRGARRRPRREVRWPALLVASAGLLGCGPTPEEAGRAVLFVAPLALLVGLGLLRLLLWPWRRVEPDLEMRSGPGLVTLGVLAVGAVLSLVGVPSEQPEGPYSAYNNGVWGVLEWADEAAYLFGPSLLAVILVTWRIWLAISRRTAFSWAFGPAVALMVGPAVPLALDLTPEALVTPTFDLWSYPGVMGIAPGALLLVLVAEALIRLRRSR